MTNWPEWTSDCGTVRLINADCLAVLPTLDKGSVDAVVTSPPYAEQRKALYGGIPEHRYPLWTANWFVSAETCLTSNASVLLNIREHIQAGEISDYVHKTRMLLRDVGFVECEELIWIKPDAPPVGSAKRPRRSWERVLWFGTSGDAFCDTKANGQESQRIGLTKDTVGKSSLGWVGGLSKSLTCGTSRHRDYVECGTGQNDSEVNHPARYPTPLAEWLVRGWSRLNAIVLDPFMGSGTTGVACVRTGRKFIGIELDPGYFEIAKQRIQAELRQGKLAFDCVQERGQ